MNYFKYFPTVKHQKELLIDITKRVNIFSKIKQDGSLFLPYTVDDDMRPEDVAHYYYGDAGLVWLVYMANGFIDPYSEWVMPQSIFAKYLIRKYKAQSGKVHDAEILEWTQKTTITDNIIHYENVNDASKISPDTYKYGANFIAGFTAGDWKPIRVYEYEDKKNEDKRDIYLVNKRYADQMVLELRDILNAKK